MKSTNDHQMNTAEKAFDDRERSIKHDTLQ